MDNADQSQQPAKRPSRREFLEIAAGAAAGMGIARAKSQDSTDSLTAIPAMGELLAPEPDTTQERLEHMGALVDRLMAGPVHRVRFGDTVSLLNSLPPSTTRIFEHDTHFQYVVTLPFWREGLTISLDLTQDKNTGRNGEQIFEVNFAIYQQIRTPDSGGVGVSLRIKWRSRTDAYAVQLDPMRILRDTSEGAAEMAAFALTNPLADPTARYTVEEKRLLDRLLKGILQKMLGAG